MRSNEKRNSMYKSLGFLFCIMLAAGFCLAGDSGGSKFRLNIGVGAGYILALRYQNQFGSTTSFSTSSKGAIYPSLNIGGAINSRFSLFFHYSHFFVYDDQSYEKIQQASYLAVASTVIPIEKLSKLYLSFSMGYIFFWWPIDYYESGLRCYGGATTVACGYRINNHFRVQIDMDYLFYTIGGSINRTTIDPSDSTNTIRNLGSSSFGDNLFNILIGLSANWDIF
jgi:hypothetical protein